MTFIQNFSSKNPKVQKSHHIMSTHIQIRKWHISHGLFQVTHASASSVLKFFHFGIEI